MKKNTPEIEICIVASSRAAGSIRRRLARRKLQSRSDAEINGREHRSTAVSRRDAKSTSWATDRNPAGHEDTRSRLTDLRTRTAGDSSLVADCSHPSS